MATCAPSDRVLATTRWVAALVIPFLIAAFSILYFFPRETERLFAWRLQPTMSAMMLAAAYAGGIFFFARVLFSPQWHRIRAGFLPVTAFAGTLGVATLLHWDRFNHSHIAFIAWAGLYFTTPFIVIAAWLRNRALDPVHRQSGDPAIPPLARLLIGAFGVITLGISVLLFFRPSLMIGVWPWALSPLTARMVSAMFALPGLVGLGVALDERWSAAQVILQAQAFSILLILVAVVRAWHEFDQSRAGTWLFVGGLVGMFVAIVLLYLYMQSKGGIGDVGRIAPSVSGGQA